MLVGVWSLGFLWSNNFFWSKKFRNHVWDVLATSYIASVMIMSNLMYLFNIHYRVITERPASDVNFILAKK